jgi:beta-lactamase class A
MLTRRHFAKFSLVPFIGSIAIRSNRSAAASDSSLKRLDEIWPRIETESGGRLGVAILDVASGATSLHRGDERFPMCSTFKLLAVAATLAKVEGGQEQLARRVGIEAGDILSYAPVTKQHAGAQGMTVGELCEAAIIWSDNTAANLLLRALGGPSAVTDYARALGDTVTRLDRVEPDLNEATPGDVRDTTTPRAMAANLKRLATEDVLGGSREQLLAWLIGCKTGDAKLRAGLPKTWRIGDKTGSGAYGSSNDVAVIWPAADHPPLVVAAYLTGTTAPDDKRNATHAAIGRAIAETIVG